MMREALAASLNTRREFVMVGSTASIDGLWGLCGLQWPDVVLADVGARESDVAVLVSRLRSAFPWIRLVLMYTQLAQSVMAEAARDAGVAFVHQSAGIEQLVTALSADPAGTAARSEVGVPRQRESSRYTGRVGDRQATSALEAARFETAKSAAHQGHSSFALVRGPAGDSLRQVVAALVDAGVPFAVSAAFGSSPADCVASVTAPVVSAVAPSVTAPVSAVETVDGPLEAAELVHRRRGPVVALALDPAEPDWRMLSGLRVPIAVVYSTQPGPQARLDAFAMGAKAMLSVADFVRALPLVASGCVVASPPFARDFVLSDVQKNAGPAAHVPGLTGRERQILNSVKAGDTVKQTARALGIAVKTVENTQGRLFCKLGVRNRSEALSKAYRLGLLDPH